MDDGEQICSAKPKAPLITPSASPPHFRPQSHRIPDQPSPTKRPRLSSAPRPTQQRASSSSSAQNETFNFHRAREESAMRLFDVWAGLAERYSRRLDEDDIIDITTGKVVKDRGILRSSQTCSVGAFADPTPDDAEDELEEDEEEDDIDELDTITLCDMEGPILADLGTGDDQDLKEFLEAEQRRREIYGSEADETEGSTYESQPEDTIKELDREISQGDLEGSQTSDPQEPIYVDSGSEDELGGWDWEEASTIYRLPKEVDNDSEVEISNSARQLTPMSPEVPPPPWTSPDSLPRRVSNQRQLQTPPQSNSSVPRATSDDFLDYPLPTSSPRSSSLPRSSSPLSKHDSLPIKSRPVARGRKKLISERSQAQAKHPSRPMPRLDLAKVSAEPPIKSKPVSQTSSTSPKAHSSDSGLSNMKKQSRMTSVQPAKKRGRPRKQPVSDIEVQTHRRTPFQAPLEKMNVSKEEEIERKPRSTAKTKGKQKAAFTDERAKSSQEDLVRRSSPPLVSEPSSRSRSLRPSVLKSSSASRDEPLLDDVGSSSRKTKPIPQGTRRGPLPGSKRKRVVSSAEMLEETRMSIPEPSTEDITRPYSRSRRRSTDASDEPDFVQDTSAGHRQKRKQSLQRQLPSAQSESDDASEEEEVEQGQRHSSRAPSHLNTPYYPYPPLLYPTHHPPDQQQPIYTPLHDPRAQYIFTHAMQQIFALGSGAWAPPPPPARGSTPFTPKHHHCHREDLAPPQIYSTPMHHPHPYPFSYDPILSRATLPPSSPEVSSSPSVSASGGRPRRKSLVQRSQSRGRRVSFKDEESDIDRLSGPDAYSDGARPPDRWHDSSGSKELVKKGKGKGKESAHGGRSMSEAEPEPIYRPQVRNRGRPPKRHQTPGPSPREKDPPRDIWRVSVAHQNRTKSRA
ncbi:hypothetical protein C0993_000210 [Termitomyces sp. T159_Od127]|nr:hypothetical protein C0993_000210 [Termitomyces sp. T159_Od127]